MQKKSVSWILNDPRIAVSIISYWIDFVLDIMLKAIKLDPLTILKGLETVDTDILPRHVLQELLKFIPTEEEIVNLKMYENEVEQLANAERFLFYVSNIHRYGEKIRACYFKCSWDEVSDDLGVLVTSLSKAIKQVMTSQKFREILKFVLALGN